MSCLFVIIVFVIAISMGRIILPSIFRVAFRMRLFDSIESRKIHSGIIPRIGGVSFLPTQFCLLMLSMFLMYKFGYLNRYPELSSLLPQFLLLMCGLILLFIVGGIDDLIGINYRWKFIAQIIAASFFPLSGLWINDFYGLLRITVLPAPIGMPLTVLLVVFIINAVNFIDGIDGLCSGIIALGCLILGSLFFYNGAWLHAVFAFITAGVLLPFFYYNVFGISKGKRRIFMGDTGSLTLGLSVAFLAVSYAMRNPDIKPFAKGAIVVAFATLIIPMFDAIRVIWIRYRMRNPLFLPDRNHIHHRLLRIGISHHATMILILLMAVFISCFNMIMVEYIGNNSVLLLDVVIWIGFNICFDQIENTQVKRKVSEQT